MNFTYDIESHSLNKTANFVRLVEQIRQCIRERELTKEQQRRTKIYSIIHYIEHIKRCINDNPLIGRALFRFYKTIENFTLQNNRFSSTIIFDNSESKMSLEEKSSIDNIYTIHSQIDQRSEMKISQSIELNNLQSTKSTTHYVQTIGAPPRETGGLLTKRTLEAIHKAPRQRTAHDIEVLEHLLHRCESLRHLPTVVRLYAARSLLLLNYHPNTILTRQNSPSFLIYMIVYGQCKLLLETNRTTIIGRQLNIGDVYGDDSLQSIIDHRLNGLITNEINSCNLIGFFSRDIRAYENYLSDIMKRSLYEQLRIQTTFLAIQWRNDILNYFLQWSNYKQYSIDEIIYGNEQYEHKNLYFILHGQVSLVCLLDFPSMIIKHPEFSRLYHNSNNQNIKKAETTDKDHPSITLNILDNESMTSSLSGSIDISDRPSPMNSNREKNNNFPRNINAMAKDEINSQNKQTKDESSILLNLHPPKTTWRFLEVFTLSNGHYFGFESTTIHSWYLTRSTVDIISIPKDRFKELGSFAPMIFEKLRQDFLDVYPTESFIRNSYIKHLKMNRSNDNEISTIKFIDNKKRITSNNHDIDLLQKLNWIPEENILSTNTTNLINQ